MPHPDLTSPKERIYAVGFRFVFCYFILFIWPFPFYFIPFFGYLLEPLNVLSAKVIDSAGPLLFGDSYNTYNPNTGSGDTSFLYTQACVYLVVALIACAVWTLADRKRSSYEKLSLILDTVLRFYLAATLFNYGFIKVFPLQFPLPPPGRLAETYGESSPMGLLWTFMGTSKLYSWFTGMGEVTAGVLLLFRRTKLFGATLAVFVFMHVFVLNLSYDVPVKLFSFHLLMISLYLAAPIVRAFRNRPVPGDLSLADLFRSRWGSKKVKWILIGLKCILIFFIAVQPLVDAFQRNEELNQAEQPSTRPGVFGTYSVSNLIRNNEAVTDTGPSGWKELKFNTAIMEIVYTDGASIQWHCKILGPSGKIRFVSMDLSTFGEFDFTQEDETLFIRGKMNQDSISLQAKRISKNYNAPLLSRGFHWVTEEPFNR